MKILLKWAAGTTSAAALACCLSMAHAEPDAKPTRITFTETCIAGLVAWRPVPRSDKQCGQLQTPQVKVFDASGRLRFIGSALDSIQWVKAGQPSTPIPEFVVVRDAVTEARKTHMRAPAPGHGWVTYYGATYCPPCETQLVTFRSEVMPKLGQGTTLSVLEISE